MTFTEFAIKWCPEIDHSVRRAHMALTDMGYGCKLIEHRYGCGCVHQDLSYDDPVYCPPMVDVLRRSAQLTMSPEMFADWCAAHGAPVDQAHCDHG